MQLHKILGYAGFLMFIVGSYLIDTEMFFVPIVMYLVGLGLLLWSAYEDGYFNRRKR